MFETKNSEMISQAIFSEDGKHRYQLTKTWDESKKIITVITKHPHYDGVEINDLTTHLVLNELSKMEYGKVHLVNLFSEIRTTGTTGTTGTLKEGFDKHTDIHIIKSVKESDDVLLAWGAVDQSTTYQNRINDLLKQIKTTKKPVQRLINPQTDNITHPLSPVARKEWIIKK